MSQTSPNNSSQKAQKIDKEENKKLDQNITMFLSKEFYERKLDIQPKRLNYNNSIFDTNEDIVINRQKILNRLQNLEKVLEEKIYKTRLDIQENLLMPKSKIKVNLRTHIFAYSENGDMIINIQGKIIDKIVNQRKETRESFRDEDIPDDCKTNIDNKENIDNSIKNDNEKNIDSTDNKNNNENKDNIENKDKTDNKDNKDIKEPQENKEKLSFNQLSPTLKSIKAKHNKFTHYFNKVEIKFDDLIYQDITWTPDSNATNLNGEQKRPIDTDGFTIRRPFKNDSLNVTFYFYLNYTYQEYVLSPKLALILGIKKETRPKILYYLWQYIKINSLQDHDNPLIIINNSYLRDIFKCEKMSISSLITRLNEHLSKPEPVKVQFCIKNLNGNFKDNQILFNIHLNLIDPYYNSLLCFFSTSKEESFLFPKKDSPSFISNTISTGNTSSTNSNNQNFSKYDRYLLSLSEIDRQFSTLKLLFDQRKKRMKFYKSFSQDPIIFIRNFLIQEKYIMNNMKTGFEGLAKIDRNNSLFYCEYEELIREEINKYLGKKRGNMGNQ